MLIEDAQPRPAEPLRSPAEAPGMTFREWCPGARSRPVTSAEALASEGVISIEVPEGSDAWTLHDWLTPFCGPDLRVEMIEDLLEPDPLPKAVEYGESGHLRALSAFGVTAVDSATAGTTGTLVFELVEFLANERWILLCRHRAKAYAAAASCRDVDHMPRRDLFADADRTWAAGGHATAGDLGVVLLHQLTRTYQPARRQLATWLQGWETAFFTTGLAERDVLGRLHGLIAEFRARLSALNVPIEDAQVGWFTAVTHDQLALRTDRELERTIDTLGRLGDRLRGGFDLLQSREVARQSQDMAAANKAMTQQLILAEEQRNDADRRQHRMEVAGAIFVVPTLVAGVWGENTWVPGEKEWWGFLLTVAVMVIATAIALVALRIVNVRRLARREPQTDG